MSTRWITLARLPIYRSKILHRFEARLLGALPIGLRRRLFHGAAHVCPVCESRIRGFRAWGRRQRVRCPVCQSFERHRLVWVFFQRRTNLFDRAPKTMLHVAPERAFAPRLRRMPALHCLTADIKSPRAMVKMDITRIPYPDNTFDVIYCSHVLEHVVDDRKAIRELARVLKPDGWSAIVVPILGARTTEDPGLTSPAERERRFGQHDHVRSYGPDVHARLAEEGFHVSVIRGRDLVSPDEIVRLGLHAAGTVFYCTKRREG